MSKDGLMIGYSGDTAPARTVHLYRGNEELRVEGDGRLQMLSIHDQIEALRDQMMLLEEQEWQHAEKIWAGSRGRRQKRGHER